MRKWVKKKKKKNEIDFPDECRIYLGIVYQLRSEFITSENIPNSFEKFQEIEIV